MNIIENKNSIIRLFNVSKRFGQHYALKNITLDVKPGEFIFITGASGAGKSTLMKLLYLAETASEGQILVDGMNLARISRSKVPFLRRRFGVIFQDFKLIPQRTVYENVALVLEAANEKQSLIRQKVTRILKTTGMDKKMNVLPPSLSGGEQQRVAVARALVGDPAIILADEPTCSLDVESAHAILNFLLKYHSGGTTILIATHNLQIISTAVRGRCISLVDGVLTGTATLL